MKKSYDEVFLDGQPRPHYRAAWERYASFSATQISQYARAARKVFANDAQVLPFPRIITRTERRLLTLGVAQRGRAILAFAQDHYFGRQKYHQANLIAAPTLQRILRRHPEGSRDLPMQPENLQFWYAPDLVRGPDGHFRVLEDNVGFAGGMGDLVACGAAARALCVEPRLLNAQPDPLIFYRRLAREYFRQAKLHGPGKVAMLSYRRALCDTHEDERLEQAMAGLGITTVRTRSPIGRMAGQNALALRKHRLFLETRQTGNPTVPRSISFLALNVEAKDVEKEILPGLWAANRLGLSTTHGLEFTNDKEFYLYVDDLIRFYLKQAPLIPSLETSHFGRGSPHSIPVAQVFSEIEQWVIKASVGRGGTRVWIGHRLSLKQISSLQARVRANPSHFIAQRFMPLSTVLGHHVDLRFHAVIGPRSEIVSPTGWGRAIPVGGSGKVNISGHGSLSIVLSALR